MKTGPGRRRSGPVPAWALKAGTVLASLAVFAGSFGHAVAIPFAENAPLQPTVADQNVAATSATPAPTATAQPVTTLTPSVRTTTRSAVTSTRSS